MKYETLYTRDSMGNVRIWWMEQEKNKYLTVSGREDGNLVYSDWTEVYGKNFGKKNETSSKDQATKEILAKYEKQLKTGYHKDPRDIDTIQYIEPMLAKNYKDYIGKIDFVKDHWVLQKKYNGGRCIVTRYGAFTRKGEKYVSIPHIEESLISFFELHPNAVLDGELYNYDLRENLNELMSLIRKTKNVTIEDLQKSKELVEYHIYDGFNFCDYTEKTPYSERKTTLNAIIGSGFSKYLKAVEEWSIRSHEFIEKILLQFVKDGEEGVILRKWDSPYERKRSKYLLKYKEVLDAEAVILDIQDGDGNWANKAKIIQVKWEDKVFDITFKGDMPDAEHVWNNTEEWIGKEITFEYYGLTGLGTPNYGQWNYRNSLKK